MIFCKECKDCIKDDPKDWESFKKGYCTDCYKELFDKYYKKNGKYFRQYLIDINSPRNYRPLDDYGSSNDVARMRMEDGYWGTKQEKL